MVTMKRMITMMTWNYSGLHILVKIYTQIYVRTLILFIFSKLSFGPNYNVYCIVLLICYEGLDTADHRNVLLV